MAKSFYDLDYLIELNEKRLEEYTSNYQKVLERLTNIILIYSGTGIFLTVIIQHAIDGDFTVIGFYIFFSVFILLLLISLFFFVKLLLPVEVAYLDPPKKYYEEFKPEIESLYPGQANKQKVDDSLKGSYILELDDAITNNSNVFARKSSFYYNALIFALLAVIPYIVWLGYHLTKKEDKVQKVELVSPKK
jgi:hypothetical protein